MIARHALLLGVGAALVAGTARADDALSPEAQQHLDLSVAAYKAGDFVTASKEIEAAYAIDPKPQLLYTWAQAKRLGGRCDEAIELYRRFAAAGATDEQRTAAQTGISLCDKELAKTPVEQPPTVDEPRRWYHNKLGDGLLAGGVVATGIGIGFFIGASRSKTRADKASQHEDFVAAIDEATTRRRIAIVMTTIGVGLGAGAVFVFLRDKPEATSVAISTDGQSLFVAGAF
ncbi:MAG: tetratricopeptide repeat protein [Kofleriaceae bacterium]